MLATRTNSVGKLLGQTNGRITILSFGEIIGSGYIHSFGHCIGGFTVRNDKRLGLRCVELLHLLEKKKTVKKATENYVCLKEEKRKLFLFLISEKTISSKITLYSVSQK